MPVVGAIFGGADFSRYFILLDTPEGYAGPIDDYAALKEAGAAMIGYGSFITAVLNFLILAFIIFLLVRYTKKIVAEFEERAEEAPPAPQGPTEVDLLEGNSRRVEEARLNPGHFTLISNSPI